MQKNDHQFLEVTAQPQTYSLEYLSDKDLLLKSDYMAINNYQGELLYIGIYSKKKFKNIHEFYNFTTNVSSLTQCWYRHNDLKEAYDWYCPPEQEHTSYIPKMKKGTVSVKDFIKSSGLIVDYEKIPEFNNVIYYHDDLTKPVDYDPLEHLQIIGEHEDYYVEIFVAQEVG